MREIKHKGIIKLYEIYESEQYINLIMEQNKSVGLVAKMKSKKRYSEGDVAKMMKSLMITVQIFHDIHIIHRDLNLDNLIVL